MKCEVCGRTIAVQIFKGTKICCDMCRKIWNGELRNQEAVNFLITVSGQVTPWEHAMLGDVVAEARRRRSANGTDK